MSDAEIRSEQKEDTWAARCLPLTTSFFGQQDEKLQE